MSYNIQALKNDLSGVLHGTTNNQIQNLDGVINRAARRLLLDIDPQETKRTVEFVNPIFNTVFDYPIADDVKGNKLIDIMPQVNRIPRDIWSQSYNQAFDLAKQNIYNMANMFTMNFNTGIKSIRINAPFLNPPVILNDIEAISDNGTWAIGGTASNLEVNNMNYVQGAGSLEFDVTTGAAYIENSTMFPIDISSYEYQASEFVWVYVPTGADLTSVQAQWGSGVGDYYSKTVSLNQQGVAFVDGWNLCQFDWSSAATTGAPDPENISYLRVTLNVTDTMYGCKVNGFNNILGTILAYEYYSKYMFRDSVTGAFQETVTDDSNLINLDTESYNLLFNLVAYYAGQQQQGLDSPTDTVMFKNEYDMGVARYKSLYKSEVQKPQTTYYRQPDTSNSRFLGRRYNS